MRNVLKYPGSKWRIANKIIELIPEHHTYVEPYFGSGAVFFKKAPSNIETINDLDSNVTNLFQCIQKDAERLSRIIMTTPFSRELYDRQFENSNKSNEEYEKANDFLIRCWQGHGYRTNGYKVGWKNDVQGRERMYAMWNWYRLPEWVIEIADRLRCTQIENRKGIEVISAYNYEKVFMYIDPPYMLSTRAGKQYAHEMDDKDHECLLKKLLETKSKVMVSGYESEMYNDYFHKWNKNSFESHTEKGVKRKENIWMNY